MQLAYASSKLLLISKTFVFHRDYKRLYADLHGAAQKRAIART